MRGRMVNTDTTVVCLDLDKRNKKKGGMRVGGACGSAGGGQGPTYYSYFYFISLLDHHLDSCTLRHLSLLIATGQDVIFIAHHP
jgi:hypothetical protein